VAYMMYIRGLEVVKARALAHIGVEEGMWAIVSIIRRLEEEEVFLVVKVARIGLERLKGSGRRLVRLAYT
jgi:hypothetical protein